MEKKKLVNFIKMKKTLPFIMSREVLKVDSEGNTYRIVKDDFWITPFKIPNLYDEKNKIMYDIL